MFENNSCFCTIITKGYFIKGLALYESIAKQTNYNFHMWICAMDKETNDGLVKLSLDNVTVFKVQELENEELLDVKKKRNIAEYCWTIKASLIKSIFLKNTTIKSILYVDSDIFLFSNPEKYFQNLVDYDSLLTSHNFSRSFCNLNKEKGYYNAGIIGFKNSTAGMEIISWWEKKCIEWCYDQVAEGRFGDQKYLDYIPERFKEIYIVKSLGGNAAMWNISQCEVNLLDDNILLNGDILVFYHFSNFYIINESEFDIWNCRYEKVNDRTKKYIYTSYIKVIREKIKDIKRQDINYINFKCTKYNQNIYNYYYIKE